MALRKRLSKLLFRKPVDPIKRQKICDGKKREAIVLLFSLMKNYSSHRYEQQLADEVTERAYEYIIGCKAIKAILAGHLHNDYISIINNSLIQLVSGVSSLREVYFD